MLNKKTIEDIEIKGKRVLVRCDFNVPQDDSGKITDDRRIVAALPTIEYLIKNNAKVILCSHLGRPKGEFNMKYSLKPVAERLEQLLRMNIYMAEDVIGDSAKALVNKLQEGEIMLLENVRFHKEEEANDMAFCKALAEFADVYVNDAFGTAHRAHATTEGVSKYLPAVCGYLIQKEIEVMGKALANPARPFISILGGKKVSDKISVIENLIDKVDTLLIGGGMAYTFFKAKGYEIGKSICEDDKLELARELLEKAMHKGVKLLLPIDNVVATEFSNDATRKVVPSNEIPADWEGLDIGPATVELFEKELRNAKTVVWNGPMGVFELENFAVGTNEIARVLGSIDAVTIIGGGDSAAAIEKGGFSDKMTHISTGGGASLEFLEGKTLPGIACLLDR